MENDALERQLAFIREIDKLKTILRHSFLMDASRHENDAEHSWHLAMMAMLLAPYAAGNVDTDHVMRMVLVHDLVEIDAGDTYAYDPNPAVHGDKAIREQKAADRLFGMLPEEQGTAFRALWDEFEASETPDGQFAAALDRLQPLMHNVQTQGKAWKEGQVHSPQVMARMEPIRHGMPALWPLVESMVEESVQKGYLLR